MVINRVVNNVKYPISILNDDNTMVVIEPNKYYDVKNINDSIIVKESVDEVRIIKLDIEDTNNTSTSEVINEVVNNDNKEQELVESSESVEESSNESEESKPSKRRRK